jgi:hypothetical protein
MKQSTYRRQYVSSRRGVVLVCVLACTLIAISLAASALHLAMHNARASKQELRSRQTQWLLQAGVQRARRALRSDDYLGEEWLVPADQLPESEGRVVIEVAPSERLADNLHWQVTVTAEYGSQGSQPLRRSHSFSIERRLPAAASAQ